MSILKAIKNIFSISGSSSSNTGKEFSVKAFSSTMQDLYQVPHVIAKDILFYLETQTDALPEEQVIVDLYKDLEEKNLFYPLDDEEILISYYDKNEKWVLNLFNEHLDLSNKREKDVLKKVEKFIPLQDVRAKKTYIVLVDMLSSCASEYYFDIDAEYNVS